MGSQKTSSLITDEQRQSYERDGYLVIDDPCRLELIDQVLAEVEPLLHDTFDPGPEANRDGVNFARRMRPVGPGYYWERIRDAWKTTPSVRALALAPEVLATTEELFGYKVLPFQTLNFPVGTEQRAHQDSMHFDSEPPGYMCGVWVALEDMDMDNGPLVYYPGSHTLPKPTWDEIAEVTGQSADRNDYEDYGDCMAARHAMYEVFAQDLIAKHGLEPDYATIRKGQALLWAPNLLHGGSPQRDKSRTRHSQVTHYYFEGSRQLAPMRQEPDHTFWMYPEWVKDPMRGDDPQTIREAVEANVPAGSTVAIATDGYEGLLELQGRNAVHFPRADDGGQLSCYQLGEDAVERLESLRAEGGEYVVFPKAILGWLINGPTGLQEHLEDRYTTVFKDGGICVVYELS
jgi:ectoine hydroxylase-related dioxygenase (phytanoyl-CoA dioxygenase family)